MKTGVLLDDHQRETFYGSFYKLKPDVSFNHSDVPADLRALIPYAAFWGITDDWDRETLVGKAPAEVTENLKAVIRLHDDQLDQWLAGPAASKPPFSEAYLAFSAMRIAADFC